jgi:hypothetical protein
MSVSPVGYPEARKMSALFNLKMVGTTALALGISTVSLWPERASANIVFDFNGTCNFSVGGCPGTTDTVTGSLVLTDAYVYGTEITSATFISFGYFSHDITIGSDGSSLVDGGGDAHGNGTLTVQGAKAVFEVANGQFFVDLGNFDVVNWGNIYSFTNENPPPAPEPSTWAMMLLGFAGLGLMGYRQTKRVPSPLL